MFIASSFEMVRHYKQKRVSSTPALARAQRRNREGAPPVPSRSNRDVASPRRAAIVTVRQIQQQRQEVERPSRSSGSSVSTSSPTNQNPDSDQENTCTPSSGVGRLFTPPVVPQERGERRDILAPLRLNLVTDEPAGLSDDALQAASTNELVVEMREFISQQVRFNERLMEAFEEKERENEKLRARSRRRRLPKALTV